MAARQSIGGLRERLRDNLGQRIFTGADLIAVPVMQFGPSPDEQPSSALVSPFSAHLVYGFTTELVRRIVRCAM
jgi:putative membrane protein